MSRISAKKITLENKEENSKIIFTFTNDTLFSIKYYPCVINYKEVDKKISKLQKECNKRIEYYFDSLSKTYNEPYIRQEWNNENILIQYNVVSGDEYFIHYDIKLLKKYPKYK